MSLCEYKILYKGQAAEKITRNYKPVSPPKPKVKVATMTDLKKIAKNRKLKGYTKYTKKENLAKFIQQHENK